MKGIYKDDNFEYRNGLLMENDIEKNVPDEPSFKDLLFFPISSKNLIKTILVIYISYFISINYFGMLIGVACVLLYGIYLLRKVLAVNDTISSDAFLLQFIVYLIVNNFCAGFVFLAFIYAGNGSSNSLFFPVLGAFTLVLNILFSWGVLITFALAENRVLWTYFRYFLIVFFQHICYSALIVLATYCFFSFSSLSMIGAVQNSNLFVFLFFFVCSLISIINMQFWAKFLYKDLYPEMPDENID